MPYYRKKYIRNKRTGRKRLVKKSKTKVFFPTSRRYSRMGSSAGNGPVAAAVSGERVYYNQVFRLVQPLPLQPQTILTAGNQENTALQVTSHGYDWLETFWTHPDFGTYVRDRFGSIRIKGYAVQRTIHSVYINDAAGLAVQPGAVLSVCYMGNRNMPYGGDIGTVYSSLLQCIDCEVVNIPLNNPRPVVINLKMYPRGGEMPLMETGIVPGGVGNAEYFDGALQWGFAIGRVFAQDIIIYFRDVIDVIYDAYEPKFH